MRDILAGVLGYISGVGSSVGLAALLLGSGVAPVGTINTLSVLTHQYLANEITKETFITEQEKQGLPGRISKDFSMAVMPLLLPIGGMVVGLVVGLIATKYPVLVALTTWLLALYPLISGFSFTFTFTFGSVSSIALSVGLAVGVPYAITIKADRGLPPSKLSSTLTAIPVSTPEVFPDAKESSRFQ